MNQSKWLPADVRDRLTDLMKANNVTQSELAEKIGLNKSSLNRFISGATDTLAHEYVINIARYFRVSTDFLLGETDSADRCNYDIEELGLTVKAAENLYTRKVDPAILCRILEHERAGELMRRIGMYVDQTLAAGMAAQNQLYSSVGEMLLGGLPADDPAVIGTKQTLQALKQPPLFGERDGIHASLDSILQDMRKDSPTNAKEAALATRSIVNEMALSLRKGSKARTYRAIAPETVIRRVLGQLDMGLAPEHLKREMEGVIAGLYDNLTDYFRILKAAKEQAR